MSIGLEEKVLNRKQNTDYQKKEKRKMKEFYQSLSASPKAQDSYVRVLKAFTRFSPAQLVAMTSDLGWQAW
jgi:hypothetical protein